MGAVLGAAAGDVLGAPHEGLDLSLRPSDVMLSQALNPDFMLPLHRLVRFIHDEHQGVVKEVLESAGFWAYGEQTDDTAQAICVIDSVNTLGAFEMADITARLVQWYDGGSGKGLGGTTALSLMLAEKGVDWRRSGQAAIDMGEVMYQGRDHETAFSMRAVPSNGSLMRTYPIGLYFSGDLEDIDVAARDLSLVTHAYDECVAACQLASQMVGRFAEGHPKGEVIDFVRARYLRTFEKAVAAVNTDFAYAGGVSTTLGIVLEALMNNDSFEDTVVAAVNPHAWSPVERWGYGYSGPDTDTYGATVGAMAGALYGVDSIPERWLSVMHPVSADALRQKALLLHGRSMERLKN